MMRLERQAPPPDWDRLERRWLLSVAKAKASGRPPPLARKRLSRKDGQGNSPGLTFHRGVRPQGEHPRCAYCSGDLGEQSPETIDHFAPEARFPELGLCWFNLLPACITCNSIYKRDRWSCALVRPDVDPVDGWFDFDPLDGRLYPAASLTDATIVARIRLTISVLGLNRRELCLNRRRLWRDLENAFKGDDKGRLKDAIRRGPYPFVARAWARSRG